IALAAQHKLPTVYYRRYYVTSGGLISYGFDTDEQFRGAARNAGSPDTQSDRMRAFRPSLQEGGHVEGENVPVQYRLGENHIDRVPPLVTELIRRQVAVIVATGGSDPALAAKAGTTTIPIVFTIPEDPVRLGLVASLARPASIFSVMS